MFTSDISTLVKKKSTLHLVKGRVLHGNHTNHNMICRGTNQIKHNKTKLCGENGIRTHTQMITVVTNPSGTSSL